ncbi:MAG: hypothetical protein LBH30_07380 [Prevotellaceae bacterium]|jgi:hypothetical protein|nr:hypothetical protein [Prevotellaceae bacterium]
MRKTVLALMCMVAVTMFTACGGNSSKNNTEKQNAEKFVEEVMNDAAQQTEINANNWQQTVKKVFGVDIACPNGWSFKDVKTYFSGDIVIVYMEKIAEDAESEIEVCKTLFEATQAASSEGNFNVDVDSETYRVFKGQIYENFDDIYNSDKYAFIGGDGFVSEFWYYKYSGVKVLTFGTDKGQMAIKFEKSKISV